MDFAVAFSFARPAFYCTCEANSIPPRGQRSTALEQGGLETQVNPRICCFFFQWLYKGCVSWNETTIQSECNRLLHYCLCASGQVMLRILRIHVRSLLSSLIEQRLGSSLAMAMDPRGIL